MCIDSNLHFHDRMNFCEVGSERWAYKVKKEMMWKWFIRFWYNWNLDFCMLCVHFWEGVESVLRFRKGTCLGSFVQEHMELWMVQEQDYIVQCMWRKWDWLFVMLIGTSYFHMCCVLWAVEDECIGLENERWCEQWRMWCARKFTCTNAPSYIGCTCT